MGSAYDLAANLSQLIEDGSYSTGQRFPTERALAQQTGMARNTVRRALKLLEKDGVLTRHVGRGTFITKPAAGASHLISARMELASPADLFEVRLIFEPMGAALAAGRASAEELESIRRACEQTAAAADLEAREVWDARFHLAIMRATKNALLIDYCEAINSVRQQRLWFRLKERTMTPELQRLFDSQHAAVFAALKERDAERAREAQHQHIVALRKRILGE
jgi:DNA-binding FadR family transcriptional regulator